MEKKNKYGSIPDLPDDELANPEELERQVFLQDWGPILELPIQGGNPIKPNIDEYFGVDWGAFATVDFERTMPRFDKLRYKEDRLREELKDVLIMVGTAVRHVRVDARRLVLRHLRLGAITLDDIVDTDMLVLARLYLRVWRIQDEMTRLTKASARRRRRAYARLFDWEGGEGGQDGTV